MITEKNTIPDFYTLKNKILNEQLRCLRENIELKNVYLGPDNLSIIKKAFGTDYQKLFYNDLISYVEFNNKDELTFCGLKIIPMDNNGIKFDAPKKERIIF